MTDEPAELSTPEARVVAAVMSRITKAPAPDWNRTPWIDPLTLWRPALAAAAMIALASAWSIARRPDAPVTVIQALGLPAPVTRWVESGDPVPMLTMPGFGGAR